MANLKEEFQKQASFVVLENGKSKRVPAATFRRESAKYIGMGYGRYFDISEEEANEKAAKGAEDRKQNKIKEEKRLNTLKETAETAAKQAQLMASEMKKLDKNLTAAKKLTDEQQKANANLTNENAQLKKELEDLLKKQLDASK